MTTSSSDANALLDRALAALTPDVREALALRLGYHPQMLALSVAGQAVGRLAEVYRAALERAPHALGASPTLGGHALGPLVERLQSAARGAVLGDPEVAQLAEDALRDVLACALGETRGRG